VGFGEVRRGLSNIFQDLSGGLEQMVPPEDFREPHPVFRRSGRYLQELRQFFLARRVIPHFQSDSITEARTGRSLLFIALELL